MSADNKVHLFRDLLSIDITFETLETSINKQRCSSGDVLRVSNQRVSPSTGTRYNDEWASCAQRPRMHYGIF